VTSAPRPPVRLTAAVPAYNEGDRLPRFLADWVTGGLPCVDPVATLIVVDDHSAADHETRQRLAVEAARDALAAAGAAHRAEYLRAPRNQGKGASIRAGWHRAGEGEDWLGFIDADGAVPAREFWRVAALLPSATDDAICGSRVKMAGRSVERSLFRHIQGRAFATLVEGVFHFGFYDTQCGFKFFRAERLRPVLARLREDRWLLDIEVLDRLRSAGARFAEVPVDCHQQRPSSLVVGVDPLRIAARLFALRRRLRRETGAAR
jgi:dolichyl-phosphate beta-glucosyltransferase